MHPDYYGHCNRCGRYAIPGEPCVKINGCLYGFLCTRCRFKLECPEEWEQERLELVPHHSE